MHFLNACILKTDEKNAMRFKNADFKNQMSDAITSFVKCRKISKKNHDTSELNIA